MSATRTGRVILAVGDSLADLAALRQAVALAAGREVPLYAVRVGRPPAAWPVVEVADPGTTRTARATAFARAAFDQAMGGVPARPEVLLCVLDGPPGPTLARYADRPDDVIVVGGPGHRRWYRSGARLAGYLVRHARCPVFVVPAPVLVGRHAPGALVRALRRELDQVGGQPG